MRNRVITLSELFAVHPKYVLDLSSEADSAYLLYAGARVKVDLRPYYIKTALQPWFEQDDALRLVGELGTEMMVLELDVLVNPRVAANPVERCYHCKQSLPRALRARAVADGHAVLLDGTNAFDEAGGRPGMKALRESEVRSPLRGRGLTKADICHLSREVGLFARDKPAYTCLVTWLPMEDAPTEGLLARVEEAEDILFCLGYADFRVRVFRGAAQLQFPAGQLERAVRKWIALQTAPAPYLKPILPDLEKR